MRTVGRPATSMVSGWPPPLERSTRAPYFSFLNKLSMRVFRSCEEQGRRQHSLVQLPPCCCFDPSDKAPIRDNPRSEAPLANLRQLKRVSVSFQHLVAYQGVLRFGQFRILRNQRNG